jgi:hypothetical protein
MWGSTTGVGTSKQPVELLFEARQTTTAIHELLVATGPRRVRLRVDVKVEGIALFAVGRVRDELGPIGLDHLDLVVVRVETETSTVRGEVERVEACRSL